MTDRAGPNVPHPIAPIAALLDEGLTWTAIALRLGLSKNTVAGRIDRARVRGELPSSEQEPHTPHAPRMSDIVAAMPVGGCRFIAAKSAIPIRADLFCGDPCVQGTSWCADHLARVWIAVSPVLSRLHRLRRGVPAP